MFDLDAFDGAQFTFPTKKIKVPELKSFFPDDSESEWEIKGLTGTELAAVNEAVETVNKTKAMIEALAAGSDKALKDGLKIFLNKNDGQSTPEDLVRRHKMLSMGSVPPCPEHVCVKLAHVKATTFYRLTNEIIRLTGDGASQGE